MLALFEPAGVETSASHAVRELGAQLRRRGRPFGPRERGSPTPVPFAQRSPRARRIEEAALAGRAAARRTSGRRSSRSTSTRRSASAARSTTCIAYEAALRAFASEAGRNLFLYEERPEAFVPGAVRTRLALLGARLPPGAAKLADGASVVRHLWRIGEPERLRGEADPARARGSPRASRPGAGTASRRPGTRFGPSGRASIPSCTVADEEARSRAQAVAEALLPKDGKGRSRSAQRFNMRATALGKTARRRLPRGAALALPARARRPARDPAPARGGMTRASRP